MLPILVEESHASVTVRHARGIERCSEIGVMARDTCAAGRANGQAARDRDRKRTFRSAHRQAEELADAADAVSYAAKPILLLYRVSREDREACLHG
jgi:energy-coupling factor transporter transmembrane protein EcfT